MEYFIANYNSEVKKYQQSKKEIPFKKFCDKNEKHIKWSSSLFAKAEKGTILYFNKGKVFLSLYRPFNRISCYFDDSVVHRAGQMPKIFPTPETKNLVICVSGVGSQRGFSCMIADKCPNLDFVIKSQCFSLYYYEKRSVYQPTLFDGDKSEYTRKDGITNFILERCRASYGPKVSKEDIFYYVYGLLHSRDYLKKFDSDINKMLPRLPLVEKPADFDVVVSGAEQGKFRVEKMRFPDKQDKTTIEYNPWITLSHIPQEACEYVVNGRSAVEWIMERYQIKTDKASGISNDPNDWATEQGKPRYILDLLLSVITVSVETVKIVNELPGWRLRSSSDYAG